jgi:hypothetical protein
MNDYEEVEDYENEEHLPPHKRTGYFEAMYELADMQRKAAREEELLRSAAANEWAIETGAKP